MFFKEIRKDDLLLVGKKAFDLNMLYSNRFNVPPGFVVTSHAYRTFLSIVEDRIERLLAHLNKESLGAVPRIATEIQHLILNTMMPREIADELLDAYDSMNVDVGYSRHLKAFDFLKAGARGTVAIRSSMIANNVDTIKNSECVTFLNLTGATQLRRAVQACFAAMFTQKNIKYRLLNDIDFRDVSVAVLIQTMVKAEKSGVLYTTNPDSDVQEAYVEAAWGLGKTLDEVFPDKYIIDKKNNKITSAQTARQSWGYYGDAQGRIIQQELPIKKTTEPKLNAHNLIMLSNLARELEENYEEKFKIEFGIVKEEIWLLGMESLHKEKPMYSFSVEEEAESSNEEMLVPEAFEKSIDEKIKMEEELEKKKVEVFEEPTEHKVEETTEEERDTIFMPNMTEDEMNELLDKFEEEKAKEKTVEEPEEIAKPIEEVEEKTEMEEAEPIEEVEEKTEMEEAEPIEEVEEMAEIKEDTMEMPAMTEKEMGDLLDKFEEPDPKRITELDPETTEFVEEPNEGEDIEETAELMEEPGEEPEEEAPIEFVPKAEEFSEAIENQEPEEKLEPGQTLSADEIIKQASEETPTQEEVEKKPRAKSFEMQIIESCDTFSVRYPHAEDALKAYRDEILRLYRNR